MAAERRVALEEARSMVVGEHPGLAPDEKETCIVFPRTGGRPGMVLVESWQARYIRWLLNREEFEPLEIVAVGDRVVGARGWLPEGYVSLRLQERKFRQDLGRDSPKRRKRQPVEPSQPQ